MTKYRNTNEKDIGKGVKKMKIKFRLNKFAVMLLVFVTTISSMSVFAVWWGTPGYEWCLSNGLTSIKTKNQLQQVVSHTDLYSTILNYLQLKGVEPSGDVVHHYDDMYGINPVVADVFKMVNSYTTRTSLTADEYRTVDSLVEHAKDTFSIHEKYLTKDSVKNVNLYMTLSKYKAAKLIEDREYREYVLARLGNVKNSGILVYGITPYVGNITRKEFLLLMYDLLSDSSLDETTVINQFNESGVLLGYESDLMLDKELTYTEMLTFLYRFEGFDFGSSDEE